MIIIENIHSARYLEGNLGVAGLSTSIVLTLFTLDSHSSRTKDHWPPTDFFHWINICVSRVAVGRKVVKGTISESGEVRSIDACMTTRGSPKTKPSIQEWRSYSAQQRARCRQIRAGLKVS